MTSREKPDVTRPEISLEVRNVTVTYRNGNTALQDASFSLSKGSICGLVGVNGSGKSTLFKAIMGFTKEKYEKIKGGRPTTAAALNQLAAGLAAQGTRLTAQFSGRAPAPGSSLF